VCFAAERRLSEYSPDGTLIHRINLPPAMDHPWRAVTLAERLWVVCHGGTRSQYHRICYIDGQHKQINRIHGEAPGSDIDHLNEPRSIVVDTAGHRHS